MKNYQRPIAKRCGLGEPGVFLVWGPLMIGGTFYAGTGVPPGWVWVASLPYAILVPLWLFLAAVVLITIHSGREVCQLPWFFVGRTLSSRAPPILSTL